MKVSFEPEEVFVRLQLGKESQSDGKESTMRATQLHSFPFRWTRAAGSLAISQTGYIPRQGCIHVTSQSFHTLKSLLGREGVKTRKPGFFSCAIEHTRA